ncbi:hypothetical protein ACC730_38220, partial [Rhizobium ruizarguesonis]
EGLGEVVIAPDRQGNGKAERCGVFANPSSALATLIFVDRWEWTPLVALILLALTLRTIDAFRSISVVVALPGPPPVVT